MGVEDQLRGLRRRWEGKECIDNLVRSLILKRRFECGKRDGRSR
jgi:hypothetical protein